MAVLPIETPIPILPLKNLEFSQMSRLQAPSGWLDPPCLHLALLLRNPAIPSQVKWHKLMLSKQQNLAFAAVQLSNNHQECKSLSCFCIFILLRQCQWWGLFSTSPPGSGCASELPEFSMGHFQEMSPKLCRSLGSCLAAL